MLARGQWRRHSIDTQRMDFAVQVIRTQAAPSSRCRRSSRIPGQKRRAVSDDVFALYSHIYAYEKKGLEPVLESFDEGADLWRREKVDFKLPTGMSRSLLTCFCQSREIRRISACCSSAAPIFCRPDQVKELSQSGTYSKAAGRCYIQYTGTH